MGSNQNKIFPSHFWDFIEALNNKEMFLVPKMVGSGEIPLRIEILKKLDVEDFKSAFQQAINAMVDGLQINVVSLEDLILLKKAAAKNRNKSRDSEDLAYFTNAKKEDLK